MDAVSAEGVERRFAEWLLERNRRGLRTLLGIAIGVQPLLLAWDFWFAPGAALPLRFAGRLGVTLVTAALFFVVRSRAFARWQHLIASAYVVLCAGELSAMTVSGGGLASPLYAGLSLVSVATGLLFLWPLRVVVWTHALVVLSFLLPNFAVTRAVPAGALGNLAFLAATAIIAGVGQAVAFRSQRETLRGQHALQETTVRLTRAHDALQDLSRFKSQFFANMTHELRTPLALIVSPLELLLDGELGGVLEPQRALFDTMFRSGLKLLKLINDLLDLSRLEESKLRLRVEEHELVGFLRGLVEQTQVLARRKELKLRFFAEVEQSRIHCDLERIERVVVNLLANAIKFTEPGGTVQVFLLDGLDSIRVVVEDDGPGFPPEQAERLFERFYQADMAGTRRHGGTGIGLALARELTSLHGGKLSARSEPGKGARFTVELRKGDALLRAQRLGEPDVAPAQRDESRADWAVQMAAREDLRLLDIAEASERRAVERDVDEDTRRHTVLIVEDTPEILRLLHMVLRREFRVLAAQDGLQGLALAQRERPSLIITDLMMPGIDGLTLTRRLREEKGTQAIPIIMLTSRGDQEDRVAGLETGVNAYVAKPFSAKELLATARSLLREQAKTADLVLNRRMDALETVAAGLAHEINNPLNYAKNALSLVQRDAQRLIELSGRAGTLTHPEQGELGKMSSRLRELLSVADSGLSRIGGTVSLMESYGRAGYVRVLRPHDAFAAARDVLGIVLPATGRGVQAQVRFEGDGTVECVPEELAQALTNLVTNAVEAVPADGTGVVIVSGERSACQLVLRVEDNGHGISPTDQQRLFTPFFTTKAPGGGMGLGLSITWRVVQSLHGTLGVESAPGKGSVFTLTLPLRQPVQAPAGSAMFARPPMRGDESQARSP